MQVKTAIVLAAGKGQRLDRPDQPKALVQVGYKPLLLWNLEQLQQAGVEQVFVVIGEKGDQIRREFTAHPGLKSEPHFVEAPTEGSMLESIQVALRAMTAKGLAGPCFLVMSDLVLEQNPYELLVAQMEDADGAVLVGVEVASAEASGAQSFVTIDQGWVKDMGRLIAEKQAREVGVYLLREQLQKDLQEHAVHEEQRMDDIWVELLTTRRLKAVALPGNWFDVNTPETCIRAELFVRSTHQHIPRSQLMKPALPETVSFTRTRSARTQVVVERGLMDRLTEFQVLPFEHASSSHYLLTDTTVDALFGERVLQELRKAGYDVHKIVMSPGEDSKTFANYQLLAERLLAEGIDEQSVIFSLGGGAVGNVAGLLASTLYRGIGLVHIPTTLMAQADAAIGIKQGVNGEKGKNLVGTYYEPLSVLIDPNFLEKLPERSVRDGLGECVKHALAQSAEYYKFFRDYRGPINDLGFLEEVIRRNAKLKIEVMEKDFPEEHEAVILQYGHEVGHAVEYLSGYTLYHGESVVIGMRASAELAVILGMAQADVVRDHIDLFQQYGFAVDIPPSISTEAVVDALRLSKKARRGGVRFALVDKIGHLWRSSGEFLVPCDVQAVARAVQKSRGNL